jgi:hypothetical protein
MIKKYNPIEGVPKGHYYIREIIQFCDFEVEQKEQITYTSDSKQELLDLCEKSNWYVDVDSVRANGGWQTHFIEYRK